MPCQSQKMPELPSDSPALHRLPCAIIIAADVQVPDGRHAINNNHVK